MGKSTGFYISLLIVIMDVIAGILGIQAEIAQNRAKHLRVMLIFECREPSHRAFRLALAAALILGLAHVIANLLGGCFCICSKEEFEKASANRQLAVICLFISWIIVLVGFSLLMIAALANSKPKGSCGFSHHHYMSIGGILCFVHAIFCSAYFVSANATKVEEGTQNNRGNTGGA